ncbi:hypothetical protein FIBSPDRAFT_851684 [Athelia psychrophila]|uniref:Uncharacterized protein n=1 Tax=Athelia psychrophila TaxID=1759441 RepID=A0A166SCR7_9AGAM|nr:hypothetical protein FIBSPDRAFT_851684 [Fibularhizoctonia sp. CBS 109695]
MDLVPIPVRDVLDPGKKLRPLGVALIECVYDNVDVRKATDYAQESVLKIGKGWGWFRLRCGIGNCTTLLHKRENQRADKAVVGGETLFSAATIEEKVCICRFLGIATMPFDDVNGCCT